MGKDDSRRLGLNAQKALLFQLVLTLLNERLRPTLTITEAKSI